MIVAIPRETQEGERRVAATPETVQKMIGSGLEVRVESGAGDGAFFTDREYEEAGARIESSGEELWSSADLLLKVQPPGASEAPGRPERELLRPGSVLIGLLASGRDLDAVRALAEKRVTSLAMELIPRITRAQSMDALSSQASIAGYRAAILGAARLGRYFPLLMTAAGTIRPARVVVMGAGVAGLQALATAKRLGAVVEVTDIRAVVKEQVTSLGGRFIDLPEMPSGEGEGGYAKEMGEEFLRKQRQILTQHVGAADVVITTALVPGKPAPRLLSAEMVGSMRRGSVVVDLAAEQGGNCELTRAGEEVEHGGVLILGPVNLPSTLPHDASTLYARNLLALVAEITAEGKLALDFEDEIVSAALFTHEGEIVHQPTAERLKEAVA